MLLVAGIVASLAAMNASLAARRWAHSAEAAAAEARAALREARERLNELQVRPGSHDVAAAQIILTADAPPARVLRELEATMGPDVRLSSLRLGYRDSLSLELGVEARVSRAYDDLIERLDASDRFVGLSPGPESREGELSARLSARYEPHRDLP